MERISAYHYSAIESPIDKAAHHIFKEHGGKFVGAGTWLVGNAQGERDIEYEIPDDQADACRVALKAAGLRLSPTPQ